MNTSLIRWTKDDKANLRKAVNNFNAKIRRLEKLDRENLPEKVSYKELVKSGGDLEILSRKELNQTIKSLQRFTKRGAETIVKLQSGEDITKWQRHEIRLQKNRASKVLKGEIADLEWASMFGMGNKERQQKEAQLESILNIENKSGWRLKRGIESLMNLASPSRELRSALNWKDNFINALDDLDGFNNVDLLKQRIEEIKNPVKLYEFINQSEILKDLFLFYKEKATSQTYGGFDSNQEAFDTALIQLGILQQ